MIHAVVPAGGLSTRMGRPKLALPLGPRSVLERIVMALRTGGADFVLVVVGPHVPELVDLARGAGAETCLLPSPTPDMRATVQAGLDWIERCHSPSPADAWLLAPADHPTLDPAVVERLLSARLDYPGTSIFVPTHAGRRGHPTLIGWPHVATIRDFPLNQGLNAYFRARADQLREVPVATSEIFRDLDTPEDYERLLRDLGTKAPAGSPSAPPHQNR